MKIIGLDSSGLVAGVALWEDGVIRADYTTNYKKTHSQTLLPMLDEIRNMTDLDMNSIDAIAIAAGPGSYTGLRIGAATAKGLGLALDKPIIEVPTLEGLAFNLWGTGDVVCPLMDARRQQVYAGIYEFNPDLNALMEQSALPVTDVLDKINEIGRPVIFLGDGAPVYKMIIEEKVNVPYRFAPAHRSHQSAASVATLGAMYFEQGCFVSAADHAPVYLRKSQAENEGPKDFLI
ncbi:MAG: tRNA (adenosine(37)-N6)-threonylcarbamoyltransferase complex dimerization subunit type 1 TsaB [Lachnospiraceae bacterium]|nr:tRNA (adenosine(37)-N6)-threonylcarbamoyltransferase complex dimerization subunit type 1 TsaB [Lachnospiraceae bacterium]